MKLCWLDIRDVGDADQARSSRRRSTSGSTASSPTTRPTSQDLPPTVTKVLVPRGGRVPDELGAVPTS